jgi:hypothetical protein
VDSTIPMRRITDMHPSVTIISTADVAPYFAAAAIISSSVSRAMPKL